MDSIPAGRRSDSADAAPGSVKDGCDAMRAKGAGGSKILFDT